MTRETVVSLAPVSIFKLLLERWELIVASFVFLFLSVAIVQRMGTALRT